MANNTWSPFHIAQIGVATPPQQSTDLLDVQIVDGGFTVREALRLIAAFAAGDKTATTIKAAGNDAKTRITYTASGETRTVSGLDVGD